MLNVSALIDERKDPFFKRGERLGLEKGISETTLDVIVSLILQSDHGDSFIANIARVEEDDVAQVRNIIRLHPSDFWEKLKGIQVAVKQRRERTIRSA